MTNDYKKLLLEYITTNLPSQTGVNKPSFSNVIREDSDVYDTLSQELTYGFVERGILKCKNSEGVLNGKTIVYGNYYTSSQHTFNEALGFIVLLDEEYNLLELITKFSTGTDLSKIICLNVDEEGKLYGVDIPDGHPDGRIILLNNISVKAPLVEHYSVVLRKSYYLTRECNIGRNPNLVSGAFKEIGKSNYYFSLSGNGTSVKINVGAPNEYQDYNEHFNVDLSGIFSNAGIFATWNVDDELKVISIVHYRFNGTDYILLGESNDEYVIEYNSIINIVDDIFDSIEGIEIYMRGIGTLYSRKMRGITSYIINNEHFYLTIPVLIYNTETSNSDIVIRTVEYNNGTITKLYDYTYENQVDPDISNSRVFTQTQMINNALFSYYYICDNIGSSNPYYTIYASIILDENTSSTIDIAQVLDTNILDFNVIDMVNMYNLYIMSALYYDFDQSKFKYAKSTMIYNINNYNGNKYINNDVLVPRQVWLYDENDNIIFARNLYNKTSYNNITESTVQIPNTLLNDNIISTQKLVSMNNYILVENTDDIEKNIYETLYINFFNTISVINKNDPNNPITNMIGAIRINNAVNTPDARTNAMILRVKTTKEDGTTNYNVIYNDEITDGVCDLQFYFYMQSDIIKLELTSNDRETVYQEIDISNFEDGKFYLVSQKCHIE